MQGMIEETMQRPEGEEITPDMVRKNIAVPPELQRAYDGLVVAGMKVMFSKESHELMLKELEREGPMAKRLGEGIAGLVLLIFKESNNNLPPQVLIPAGTELLVQAADFLRKTGEAVTNKDIGDGLEIMVGVLFDKFGVSTDKVMQMVGGYDQAAPKAQEA